MYKFKPGPREIKIRQNSPRKFPNQFMKWMGKPNLRLLLPNSSIEKKEQNNSGFD